MTKTMLIDAFHAEETRVAVLCNEKLEDFDFETATKKSIKGNIYLARVIRVEPSLQAAFLEFGGNRHGFLALNELHPDYYNIPPEDAEKLLAFARKTDSCEELIIPPSVSTSEDEAGEEVDSPPLAEEKRMRFSKNYKIQDVVRRRQVILVQVVKEERAGKGAALTSYISLAGRYCILMPNTLHGGRVSRKISCPTDRKRLREIVENLSLSAQMGLIVRTAGTGRTKAELKRDTDYLLRLWEEVRERALGAKAPCLVYEAGDLITKSIRDIYSKDVGDIFVEGEEGCKKAKAFMRMLMPSHAKRVQLYKDPQVPLFRRYRVEEKIDSVYSPEVLLPSGGSLVINTTEALVAIDVNSGKATKEKNIEETALKTNLEAADEVAVQLRLRDLAGLIVIDFIDMENPKHNSLVEQRLRAGIKQDRARIQVGTISSFGLLEMSRQRLRLSLLEASTSPCSSCRGTGVVRSVESSALRLLRALESLGGERCFLELTGYAAASVAFYILNKKRQAVASLEARYGMHVSILEDNSLMLPDFRIEKVKDRSSPSGADAVKQEDIPLISDQTEPILEEAKPTVSPPPQGTGGDSVRRRTRRVRKPAVKTGDEPLKQTDTTIVALSTQTFDVEATDGEKVDNTRQVPVSIHVPSTYNPLRTRRYRAQPSPALSHSEQVSSAAVVYADAGRHTKTVKKGWWKSGSEKREH